MITASPESPQLDYAQAPRARRKILRRAPIVLLIVAAGIATWRFAPAAMRQVQLLSRERKCLNYSASTDQVIYEEDPIKAAELMIGNTEYAMYPINREPPPFECPVFTNAAAHVPACWREYQSITMIGMIQAASRYGTIAFLHERTSPSGNRRLVCIRYFADPSTFVAEPLAGFNYDAAVITPATLIKQPQAAIQTYFIDVLSSWPKHPPRMRMYAGQIDPNDASHFTIRYEMWGQSDVLDGFLDDKDQVTLKPRQLPVDR